MSAELSPQDIDRVRQLGFELPQKYYWVVKGSSENFLVEPITTGIGGTSIVFKAFTADKEFVAIKVASPVVPHNQHLPLGHEFDLMNRIQFLPDGTVHPGLIYHFEHIDVPLKELGVDDYGEGIVMEFIDGPNLRDVLDTYGAIHPAIAFKIVADVAETLDYIGTYDVVHGDMQPGNIFPRFFSSSEQPHSKLADFGNSPNVFNAMGFNGRVSNRYLAPENCYPTGPNVRRKVGDLFGLGAIFYELITSKHPFDIDGAITRKGVKHRQELHNAIARNQFCPITDFFPSATNTQDALELIMEKSYSSRIASGAEFNIQLQRALTRDGLIY